MDAGLRVFSSESDGATHAGHMTGAVLSYCRQLADGVADLLRTATAEHWTGLSGTVPFSGSLSVPLRY